MGRTTVAPQKKRPVSLLSALCALIFGMLFVLLAMPAAVVSIWRMARKGWGR